MNKITAGILGIFLFLLSAAFAFGQGFTEYGKMLGDFVQRKESAGPKGPTGVKQLDKGKNLKEGSQGEVRALSFPSRLTVISREAPLYTGHDEFSSKITRVPQGSRHPDQWRKCPMVHGQNTNGHYGVGQGVGCPGGVCSERMSARTAFCLNTLDEVTFSLSSMGGVKRDM